MQHYDIMPLTLLPGRKHAILSCSKMVILMIFTLKYALKSDIWMNNASYPVKQHLETVGALENAGATFANL